MNKKRGGKKGKFVPVDGGITIGGVSSEEQAKTSEKDINF
jgi:hypothetical protein